MLKLNHAAIATVTACALTLLVGQHQGPTAQTPLVARAMTPEPIAIGPSAPVATPTQPTATAEPTAEPSRAAESVRITTLVVATPRAPTPEPAVRVSRYYEPSEVVQAIRAVFPAEMADVMIAISRCESGLSTTAVNPSSGATGAFQMLGHGPVPADAYAQAQQALALYYAAGGLSPWVSSRACWG